MERENIKVSVIIPVYNTGSFLKESVGSIIGQTLRDIEIICVNDGSTDNSPEILAQFALQDSRIKIINQENHGLGNARNVGMSVANGTYLYFFDSDDVLELEALEALFSIAVDKNVDIVLFDGRAFYDDDSLRLQFPQYQNYYCRKNAYPNVLTGTSMYEKMVANRDNRVSICFQFYRREFLTEHHFVFRENIIHEDDIFSFLCLLKAEKVFHVAASFYQRRLRHDSIIAKKVGYKNFEGYYTVIVLMTIAVISENYSSETIFSARQQLNSYFTSLKKVASFLSRDEFREPEFSDPAENFISALLFYGLSQSRDNHFSVSCRIERII